MCPITSVEPLTSLRERAAASMVLDVPKPGGDYELRVHMSVGVKMKEKYHAPGVTVNLDIGPGLDVSLE